ncbi:ATP-binding protein [Nocardiopsis mwathae]|nr:ATP-binding protein [Nocardiopsis mwathae]
MEERPIPPEATAPPTACTPTPAPEASTGAAFLTRRRFPGLANQIKHARRFVARLLYTCPELTTATLLTSELATNALTHSASGAAGGKFEVTVHQAPGWARVEVRDLGSAEQPRAQHCDPYDTSENGRGLDLVEALSAKWGTEPRRDGLGRMVWFELVWETDDAPVP